ncbi:unnamed protein product [Ectocarpus sp. CCAP 1310/34]|nr:unnamed protein product [Ectocarpus sp. CCAP 1310/34]
MLPVSQKASFPRGRSFPSTFPSVPFCALHLPSVRSVPLDSDVRGAMVSVMQANLLNQRGAASCGPSPAAARCGLAEEDDTEATPLSSSVRTEEACWRNAVTTEDAALPRDASTCILWCAIALGALVRGYPLAHVQWANLAMAFVHNFLGDQGVYDLLRYAGKAWVLEVGLASRKDIDAYCQSVAPIWKGKQNLPQAAAAASRPSPTCGGTDDAEGVVGGLVDTPLPTKEGGLALPTPTDPLQGMKEAMPELLRANGFLLR